MISATITLETQFYDLDPMAVVWHGNYARFLEQARSALFQQIGYNYMEMAETGLAWPIVDMRIKYVASLRLLQRFTVTATLAEYENRIRIDYILRDEAGKVLTKASTTQVAVTIATGEMQFVSPPQLIEKVQQCLSQQG
ncbi:MAG: acyl-CoA thioesterase [Rhizomicrobium sp.]